MQNSTAVLEFYTQRVKRLEEEMEDLAVAILKYDLEPTKFNFSIVLNILARNGLPTLIK